MYCHIHANMYAAVVVTSSPWYARPGEDGRFSWTMFPPAITGSQPGTRSRVFLRPRLTFQRAEGGCDHPHPDRRRRGTVMRKTSLTTRASLLSFLPVCVVLATTFVALNALVTQRVKKGLRDSLEKSEELVARANAESSRRISQFAAVLAESAGLKAAIGLVREAPGPGTRMKSGAPLKRNCANCTPWWVTIFWPYPIGRDAPWQRWSFAEMKYVPRRNCRS